jgi:hypothetical protein
MAVVHFTETTGRSGETDLESNLEYRRTFQIVTDSPQDGPSVVRTFPLLPAMGDQYEVVDTSTGVPVAVVDVEAVVVAIRVEQDDENLQNWTVTVDYAGIEDPVSQPAEVNFDPVPFQKVLVDDVNGVPVMNAAGEPFEEGMTVDRHRFRLTIVKNVLDFDPAEALEYMDTVNEVPFMEFDPLECKLVIGATRVRRRGLDGFYWQVKAVIDIDRDGWTVKKRNAGYSRRLTVDGPAVPIVDQATGLKPSTPIMLDQDGFRLGEGDPPTIVEFDGYETKDWTPLNLEY